MRPKVIIPVLCVALGIVMGVLLTKHFQHPGESPTTNSASTPTPDPKPAIVTPAVDTHLAASGQTFPVRITEAAPAATNLSPQERAVIINRLQSVQMNNDAESLQIIEKEFTNADLAIRLAAKDAAVQFGDRSAAPLLRAAAEQAASPEEKAALVSAADFLELPPLNLHPVPKPNQAN
jgi:hypothetical protein